MSALTILPVVLPLLSAAILVGGQRILHRRLIDSAGIATAAAVAVLCGLLARDASGELIVTWAGAWRPREGVALGVAFVVDAYGAGLACLCATLGTASLVYSWRYFKAPVALYHALMLAFLAGMVGFCLTGDLFNLFVFFELMSVAAYALTGFKIEEEKSLEGALNFAVVNSVGAFLILIGIGLLYGRTGALNLAQIGRELGGRPPDGLVLAAFVLIVSGLAVKGAIVPFHFWLADAHAVAPTPACVLFSGVMVELGLYGIARVYWTVFATPFEPYRTAIGGVLIVAGTVSAFLGGLMCLAQRHIKRLLAFSTISHMGILLIAVGLMTPGALAGAAVYLVGHGLVKGALFLLAGILLHRLGTVDELELRGAGRRFPLTAAGFVLGVLGLAGLPPFGTGLGKALIEEAGREAGRGWVVLPMIASASLTAGAVLRVAGRVFLGWGPRDVANEDESTRGDEARETRSRGRAIPWFMLSPVYILLLGGAATGLVSSAMPAILESGRRFMDAPGYRSRVLDGTSEVSSPMGPAEDLPGGANPATLAILAGTLGIAAFSLSRHRLPEPWRRLISSLERDLFGPIRAVHSGKVGDYITWLVLGVSAFGLALALLTGFIGG